MRWRENLSIKCQHYSAFVCFGQENSLNRAKRAWLTYRTGLWRNFTSLGCKREWKCVKESLKKKPKSACGLCLALLFTDLSDGIFKVLQLFLFIVSSFLGFKRSVEQVRGLIIYILWLFFWWNRWKWHLSSAGESATRKRGESARSFFSLSICALCPANVPTRDGEQGGGREGGGGGVNQHVRQRRGEEREGTCAGGTGNGGEVGRILKENRFVSSTRVLSSSFVAARPSASEVKRSAEFRARNLQEKRGWSITMVGS